MTWNVTSKEIPGNRDRGRSSWLDYRDIPCKAGNRVLVIDGRDPIGTPLQCGELVPSNQEMKKLCPKVPEVDDLFQTPESAICRNVPEMHLVTPSGKRLRYDFDGLVLDRVAHDEALVERAKKAGAEYLVGVRVKKVSGRDAVLSDGRTIQADIIVGAGGIWILSEGPCGLRRH